MVPNAGDYGVGVFLRDPLRPQDALGLFGTQISRTMRLGMILGEIHELVQKRRCYRHVRTGSLFLGQKIRERCDAVHMQSVMRRVCARATGMRDLAETLKNAIVERHFALREAFPPNAQGVASPV